VSSTDVLLNVATSARLFHAGGGTGFADLIIHGHRDVAARGKRFGTCGKTTSGIWDGPSLAILDGLQRKVSLRLAEQDGLIYLDLADEFWRCIESGSNGWRSISQRKKRGLTSDGKIKANRREFAATGPQTTRLGGEAD
jgi:hypothetical protein